MEHDRNNMSDPEELRALEALKLQLEQAADRETEIPPAYWTNLLSRTNKRVDDATSAKALSISWAARVAIPGVVAILFFFIGLHYYVPEVPKKEGSIASLVSTLPEETVDSMLTEPERLTTSMFASDVSADIFQFTSDQIDDYFLANGNTQTAVEGMSDSDLAALLSALDNKMQQ